MIEVRTRDKVFVCVVLPLALLAAYAHFWRQPAVRRADAAARAAAALVSPAEFPFALDACKRRAEAAEAELARERRAPAPAAAVLGDPADRSAERQERVVAAFREAGLRVVGVAAATDAKDARGGAALRATGTRPAPECRAFELEGDYSAFVRALGLFAARKAAALPQAVDLKVGAGANRWRVEVWL